MAGAMRITMLATVAACLLWNCAKPVAKAAGIREESVYFRNGDVSLAGTLFLPAGAGSHPAILIYHGSGPQPRDSFMGRWFAGQGIAVLTYDKRGVGESTGDFRAVPFMDLVDDGLAGITFLKTRADINAKQIGVWGLSQGGWLGPLAASKSKDVAFVIAVSGPGVSPGDQMVFYWGSQLRDAGLPDDQVAAASDVRRKVWHYLETGEGYDDANHALRHGQSQPWYSALKQQHDGVFDSYAPAKILHEPSLRENRWFRVEAPYDPRIALRKLAVPALFLFGESDELVPVPKSVEIIRQTLTESGHRDFTIKTFPNADHVIRVQSADGARTFAPGYLGTTSEWLRKHTTP